MFLLAKLEIIVFNHFGNVHKFIDLKYIFWVYELHYCCHTYFPALLYIITPVMVHWMLSKEHQKLI